MKAGPRIGTLAIALLVVVTTFGFGSSRSDENVKPMPIPEAVMLQAEKIQVLEKRISELEAQQRTSAAQPVALNHTDGVSTTTIRTVKDAVAQLRASNQYGKKSFGAAGHLGNGYFLTNKHGIMDMS